MLDKYKASPTFDEEVSQAISDIGELKGQGLLFSRDEFENAAELQKPQPS
jgi:hypothetical protein